MATVLVAAAVMSGAGCGSSKPMTVTGAGGSPGGLDAASGSGGTGGGAGTSGGQALRFDGVDDQVVFPTGGASEQSFTAEVWFRSTATTGMLLEVFSTGGGADRSLYLKSGSVCFYVFTPASSEICSPSTTLNDGGWHHAAGVLGVAGQHLYVDGAPARSDAAVTRSAFMTDTNLRAGYGYIGANGALVYFAGELDEIRLWNVERTASEIAASRATNLDPATAGLQGYWKLDGQGTSSAARDATPNGFDGPLSGFTFSPSPWVTPDAF